jgi:hypothetical protein
MKKDKFQEELEKVYRIPNDKVENRTDLFDKSSVFENHPHTNQPKSPTLAEIRKALGK